MPSPDPKKKRLYDRRRYARHREKRLLAQKERYYADHDAGKRRKRMSYLKTRLKKFGLTLLDYYTAHRCGVCMEEMSTCHTNKGAKSKHIDHDHDTGRFRGFLCHSCNVSLGAMKDDPIRLRRAANYLERAAC